MRLRLLAAAMCGIILAGCETADTGAASRARLNAAIQAASAGSKRS